MNSARQDRRESEHESKMLACLTELQGLNRGIYGRLIDLCQPVRDRYNTAVTMVLGKFMDAVVVDNQRTARECIQV